MATKLQKWGNSLGLRIPKSYAEALKMSEGSTVKLKIVKDKLVISKKKKQGVKLSDLLIKITEKNLHKEVFLGNPQDKEVL